MAGGTPDEDEALVPVDDVVREVPELATLEEAYEGPGQGRRQCALAL